MSKMLKLCLVASVVLLSGGLLFCEESEEKYDFDAMETMGEEEVFDMPKYSEDDDSLDFKESSEEVKEEDGQEEDLFGDDDFAMAEEFDEPVLDSLDDIPAYAGENDSLDMPSEGM